MAFRFIVQLLFSYQQSNIFNIHLTLTFLCFIALIAMLICKVKIENKLRNRQEKPAHTNSTVKKPYMDYISNKRKETARAVDQLVKSPEYQRYVQQKMNPYSRINTRNMDREVSDIDDSELNQSFSDIKKRV